MCEDAISSKSTGLGESLLGIAAAKMFTALSFHNRNNVF